MNLKRLFLSLFAVLVAIILPKVTMAQLGTSSVNGVILDNSGAVIGGVSITVKNASTGQVREITSGENGAFVLTSLPPSTYQVTTNADGFGSVNIPDLLVKVGEVANLRIVLKPDVNKEVIEVRANEVLKVDTSSAQIATYMSDDKVANLPLNGRNFLELTFLLPGNAPAAVFDPSKTNTTLVSSSGQFGRTGNISIDGADNNDDQNGGTLENLPLDSVREFQATTSSYGADIGRSGSSAINVVTKNGTNDFHASGGIFFRNSSFSAIPATINRGVINALGKPSFDREQYTFSLGGPLKKDKLWYFNSFEYRKQDSILLTTERNPVQMSITNAFGPVKLRDALFLSRVDFQAGPNDRLGFRYAFEDSKDGGSGLNPFSTGSFANSQVAFNVYNSVVFNYVHIFSGKFLNDLLIQENNFKGDVNTVSPTTQLSFPSVTDGGNFGIPQGVRQNRVQFRDNVSLELGKHSLKLGGEYFNVKGTQKPGFLIYGAIFFAEDFASQDRNGDGKIDDRDLLSLFAFKSTANSIIDIKDVGNNYFSLYAQDSWKVNRRLTINAGLRYEIDTNQFNNNRGNEFAAVQGRRPSVDYKKFSPRVGINFDPFGDGKTSIHAGYGIYYDRVTTLPPLFARLFNGKNIAVAASLGSIFFTDPQGNFLPGAPTLDQPFSGPLFPSSLNGIYTFDPKIRAPYVQQFTFGFRRELAKDLVVSVDGIHTFGLRFLIDRSIGQTFSPLLGINENLVQYESSLKNWYDGLFVNVEKRSSKNLSFIASYTLSKSFNFYDGDQLLRTLAVLPLDENNIGNEKALSLLDQRHRFSIAAVYNAPFGIVVSPIVSAQSSLPIDILRSADGQQRIPGVRNAGARVFHNGQQLNAYLAQLNAAGGDIDGSPFPMVSNNLKLGDNFYTVDMRVSRAFKLKDRFNVELIAEAFNLFNRTNIRGFSISGSFSGVQNILSRDSSDPTSPGFLTSSSFGSKVRTAGGVFGSGGPRAFQFAFKVNF